MNKLLQLLAIMVCVLVVNIPTTYASTVNIVFNGVVQKTADISPRNLANKQITIRHEPEDLTWTKVKLKVTVDSASLEHTIDRIFLFKCKLLNPSECAKTVPVDFETFANTELLWSDISAKEGPGTYPQTANILVMVKLTDSTGQTTWASFWDKIVRTDFNVFNPFTFEQDDIEFHAKAMDLVDPVKKFIENFQMLPFEWAEKAVFQGSLFAAGGDEDDLDIPKITTAVPPGNEITSISKDFFFVFSETASGITNAITLNNNPSFTCGDNVCDSNLGESSVSCCFDCGCSLGDYCDLPDQTQPEAGSCQLQEDISLSVLTPTIPTVTDCTGPISFDVSARIANPPSSLPSTLKGTVTLEGKPQTVSCLEEGDRYNCPVQLQSKIKCGVEGFTVEDNSVNLTLIYNNGPNQASQLLSSQLQNFVIDLNCGCTEGFYCDAAQLSCKPESSVSLGIRR